MGTGTKKPPSERDSKFRTLSQLGGRIAELHQALGDLERGFSALFYRRPWTARDLARMTQLEDDMQPLRSETHGLEQLKRQLERELLSAEDEAASKETKLSLVGPAMGPVGMVVGKTLGRAISPSPPILLLHHTTMAPDFEADAGLAEWSVPAREWLARNESRLRQRGLRLDGVAADTVVFADGRVLVIQRAGHDSMPGLWELPGGGVDDADASILHGAARELREEAGLVARCFRLLVGDGHLHVFPNSRRTRWFCHFAFVVDVDARDVCLDPAEHQAYAWALEDKIREQRRGSRDLPMTSPAMRSLILEAFRLRRDGS